MKDGRTPMVGYDPAAYGQTLGGDYDALYPAADLDTDAAVARLAELAGPAGSVLEFGIGTGRLALPLLERGHRVAGIDVSAEMIAQLRAKPGGNEVEVVEGNFVDGRAPGSFSVVVLALNGITDPPNREAQIACFRNAARHMRPGGSFVVETYVLGAEQLHGDWSIWPRFVRREHVELQLSRYDPATNLVERTLVHLRDDGVRLVTVLDNYAWPGELDLMAREAGLRLATRHGGWAQEPFDASSRKHVSVYRLHRDSP